MRGMRKSLFREKDKRTKKAAVAASALFHRALLVLIPGTTLGWMAYRDEIYVLVPFALFFLLLGVRYLFQGSRQMRREQGGPHS